MVPNILLADSPTLGMGPIGQNLPFSEHGHIEYQIKENQKTQQQGSKYLPGGRCLPPRPDPGDGVSRSKFNFFRTWSCCISKLRESRMQQRGSKYFARRPPPTPTYTPTLSMGSVRKKSVFSVHGHVTYQIKENHKCSNMVANILPADTLDPGVGVNWSKFNF